MNKNNIFRLALVFFIVALIASFYVFNLSEYLSFEYIKQSQSHFKAYYQENPLITIGSFSFIYIISTALSIPGATLLTLLAGALFGLFTGTIIVSFSSTIGATLAFLVSRFLLRDFVQLKFKSQLKTVNDGVKKEGAFYLFSLRLIPLFPFFLINLVMGLTPMKTLTYFFVSQVGMFPATVVYVNAGTQLGKLQSLKGILSPTLIGSFVLLGILPIILKKLLNFIQSKR